VRQSTDRARRSDAMIAQAQREVQQGFGQMLQRLEDRSVQLGPMSIEWTAHWPPAEQGTTASDAASSERDDSQ